MAGTRSVGRHWLGAARFTIYTWTGMCKIKPPETFIKGHLLIMRFWFSISLNFSLFLSRSEIEFIPSNMRFRLNKLTWRNSHKAPQNTLSTCFKQKSVMKNRKTQYRLPFNCCDNTARWSTAKKKAHSTQWPTRNNIHIHAHTQYT